MRVRILGPVDVLVNGHVRAVQGKRRKAVLASLALQHGQVVDTDLLIDVAWGDTPPATSLNTLQSHVYHLRQIMSDKAAIRNTAGGYILELGEDGTDVLTAQRLIDRATRVGDAPRAARLLRETLALWRGRALVDLAGIGWFDEHAAHLEDLRGRAATALLEQRLALGEHEQLLPELMRLVKEHPFDEQAARLLMTALYRHGRQADALGAYHRLRARLRDELGIDPSAATRDLQASILRQDPVLTVTGVAPRSTGTVSTLLADGTHALTVDGDLNVSRERFESAYRLAEADEDGEGMAAAALGMSGIWVHEERTARASAVLTARLRTALTLVDDESTVGLRLRIRLAGEADYRESRYDRITALLDEARGAPDPIALADALNLAHHCLLGPEHGERRAALAAELIALSSRTGRQVDLLIGLLWQVADMLSVGDPHAERRLPELIDVLAAADHKAVCFIASAIQVMLTIRSGRFADAEKEAQECADLGTAAGDVDAFGWHGAHLVTIRWMQGRLVELLPMLEQLASSPTLSPTDNSYFAALAVAAASAGDRRAGARALAAICTPDLAALPRSGTWLVTMYGVTEAAYLLGERDTAAQAYRLLRPYAHLPMIASIGVTCFGSTHHALGVAALATGEVDTAIDHFRSAVRANLALAHWPAVIRSREMHARALTLRGGAGDLDTAARELATAAEDAEAIDLYRPRPEDM